MTKVMLITGGSRGIGAAMARLAAQRGYDVGISYVSNKAAADAVCADIRKAGRKALAVQADTAKADDITRFFKAADEQFGRPDVFFNNAGVLLGPAAKLADMPRERIERVIAVNTVGAFLCAQEAVRRMSTLLGGKGGVIVNMSSIAGRLGASNEAIDYAASKGAVDTLTIGLAKEVAGEGIRVNAVCPGLIYTDIHAATGDPGRVDRLKPLVPMQRGGSAEEVAEAVLWLCSEQASYCTGVRLDVAGGRGL
jgi:NAD(P)-dependent dehydrogenase (short-subunit alcohol dehydrogenase family)